LKNKVEELNHSNRELEEFAYIASHDLQEPLRKITTYSDRLSEKYKEALTGDGLMYLSRMIISAENMRMLINDLLEFSRISKNEQPYERVDMNMVLKLVKTDLELVIEETGTIINCESLPAVDAIPSQMKQLLANIIGNAIKFHKPGLPPVITISANILSEKEKVRLELAKNRIYYEFSISDNGIGFEEEYNTRIFQVFQRLHGKSEYPGSGIGLAICKKIIEYHHGIIYATSEPGAGARFTFILPQDQKIPKAQKT
jgi:light-regulated signal transduction histidine kinase (bacteriophytochrome)